MGSSFYQRITCISVLLIFALVISSCSKDIRTTENKELKVTKDLQGLELSIAAVVPDSRSSPKYASIAFIAKNNSNKDIVISDFLIRDNILEIVQPERKQPFLRVNTYSIPIVLKPSETKIWFESAIDIMDLVKAEDLCRIKWKIGNVESKEFVLVTEKIKEI